MGRKTVILKLCLLFLSFVQYTPHTYLYFTVNRYEYRQTSDETVYSKSNILSFDTLNNLHFTFLQNKGTRSQIVKYDLFWEGAHFLFSLSLAKNFINTNPQVL